jgi:hypothetical protein
MEKMNFIYFIGVLYKNMSSLYADDIIQLFLGFIIEKITKEKNDIFVGDNNEKEGNRGFVIKTLTELKTKYNYEKFIMDKQDFCVSFKSAYMHVNPDTIDKIINESYANIKFINLAEFEKLKIKIDKIIDTNYRGCDHTNTNGGRKRKSKKRRTNKKRRNTRRRKYQKYI